MSAAARAGQGRMRHGAVRCRVLEQLEKLETLLAMVAWPPVRASSSVLCCHGRLHSVVQSVEASSTCPAIWWGIVVVNTGRTSRWCFGSVVARAFRVSQGQ